GFPWASRIPATDSRSDGTPCRSPSHCTSPEYALDDRPAKRQSGSTSTTTEIGRIGIGPRQGLAAPLIGFLAVLNPAKPSCRSRALQRFVNPRRRCGLARRTPHYSPRTLASGRGGKVLHGSPRKLAKTQPE